MWVFSKKLFLEERQRSIPPPYTRWIRLPGNPGVCFPLSGKPVSGRCIVCLSQETPKQALGDPYPRRYPLRLKSLFTHCWHKYEKCLSLTDIFYESRTGYSSFLWNITPVPKSNTHLFLSMKSEDNMPETGIRSFPVYQNHDYAWVRIIKHLKFSNFAIEFLIQR